MTTWSGKSRGGKVGYQFFILLLKYTNIKVTYFFIRFVALYFLIASDKTSIKFYFSSVFGYSKLKTLISIYKNYCLLGEVLIDKIAILAGFKGKFTFDFEGENNLQQIVQNKKGGLLIGAHMGNWEVAGQLLERLDTKINVVLYEAEHEKIKDLLDNKMKKNDANLIPIKDDFSHLFSIKEAFNRNELVVMHGDRFLNGTNTVSMEFLNKPAQFPTGPLYLASKNNVPVSFVYTLKDSATHYHFYATKGKTNPYPSKIKTRKQEIRTMVQDYVTSLESIIKKYPLQWFNYYPFWEEEKK
ncbi:MAG: lysophospholipid acyltransferase family protein [Bacteroidota bacterium]